MTDFQFMWLCTFGLLLIVNLALNRLRIGDIEDKLDELIDILKEETK